MQFQKMASHVTWDSPSRVRGTPYTAGDDLCDLLAEKANIRSLPNRRFRKGLAVGLYYNSCGSKDWHDTTQRMPLNICCNRKRKYVDCQAAIAKRKQRMRNRERTNI